MMMDERKLIRQLNDTIKRAQRVLAEYLPEGSGKSEKDTIAELLGILDSRELHSIQQQLASRPALFRAEQCSE
jgi:hypothetical protein